MDIVDEIKAYIPQGEQEKGDKAWMLAFLAAHEDAFARTNTVAHMTASAWIVSPDGEKVVMCYHNIYNSWSWTGGHADGDRDLLAVAMREATEETGLFVRPFHSGIFSLENLAVPGHMKNGIWVSGHIHMNATYLLVGEGGTLRPKPDENRAVRWMTPEEAIHASTEPWMVERVYRKLAQRVKLYMR